MTNDRPQQGQDFSDEATRMGLKSDGSVADEDGIDTSLATSSFDLRHFNFFVIYDGSGSCLIYKRRLIYDWRIVMGD